MTDSYNQNNINVLTSTPVLNSTGATLTEGQIVAQDPALDDAVVLTTVLFQLDVIGIVLLGADDGGKVTLSNIGPFGVLITGAIARGDFIVASNTAGVGIDAGGSDTGVFAIAIESNADVGVKLVQCRFVRAEIF